MIIVFFSRSSELLEYEYELELGEEKILPDITVAGKKTLIFLYFKL